MHIALLSWEPSLQVLYSAVPPGIQCPVLECAREMLTKWNELTWLGAGEHNGCGKTQQTGRGGSGASHHPCPENTGNLHKRQGKNSSEVQRRKGTMVKSFNEWKLDQRYGKINLHTSRNLPVHGDLENMLVLSKQYDLTLEVRAPWSSWLPEGPSKQKIYMMVNT